MPGKDMKDRTPLKKLSDDKKGAPRANVVCDMDTIPTSHNMIIIAMTIMCR